MRGFDGGLFVLLLLCVVPAVQEVAADPDKDVTRTCEKEEEEEDETEERKGGEPENS